MRLRYRCRCDECTAADRLYGKRRIRSTQARRSKTFARAARWPFDGPGHDEFRPLERSECIGGERPCPWASCRHHLYLDVKHNGSIVVNFPWLEVAEMAETCSLDAADRGAASLETVGRLMNLTRERARQIEEAGLAQMEVELAA